MTGEKSRQMINMKESEYLGALKNISTAEMEVCENG